MNGHSNYDYALDDAKFLKNYASDMIGSMTPSMIDKRLREIAMRLETKFYVPTPGLKASTRYDAQCVRITDPTQAPDLLDAAAKHMRDRAATYDKPEGERSMGKTVEAFNTITGRDLRESEGWLLMALLKMVRSEQRQQPHEDSIEDLVAYSALFGEARLGGK